MFVKLLVLTLICGVTAQNNSQFNENCSEKISFFIRDVMIKLNSKDSSTRDVVLLKLVMLESSKKIVDDIHNNLLQSIPKENPIITPKSTETIGARNIRKNVVIIIVSDVSDSVSFTRLRARL